MADNGLRVMRRIDPPAELQETLEKWGQLYEIADKRNKVHKYVNDEDFRAADVNNEITGNWDWTGVQTHRSCTLGFAVMNEQNDILAYVRDAAMAQKVVDSAKVTITTDFAYDFEDDPAEHVEEDGGDPSELPAEARRKPAGRSPVAVSA
jgi:hypothetical protein